MGYSFHLGLDCAMIIDRHFTFDGNTHLIGANSLFQTSYPLENCVLLVVWLNILLDLYFLNLGKGA